MGRPKEHGHRYYLGNKKSPTYQTWWNMIQRCTKSYATQAKYYRDCGIRVCERWLKFENFLNDMGCRPYGTTLDRKKNNGDYEPGNCRWATTSEQALSRRRRLTVFDF